MGPESSTAEAMMASQCAARWTGCLTSLHRIITLLLLQVPAVDYLTDGERPFTDQVPHKDGKDVRGTCAEYFSVKTCGRVDRLVPC